MLAYAADDTRHLPALRDALRARLRGSWAGWPGRKRSSSGWRTCAGPAREAPTARRPISGSRARRRCTPRQLAALRELVAWRDGRRRRARHRAVPHHRQRSAPGGEPGAPALGRCAERDPRAAGEPRPALRPGARRRRWAGRWRCPSTSCRSGSGDPAWRRDPELEARVERLKTARNAVAQQLAIDPGVLCGKATLEAIARARPRDRAALAEVGELRRWQVDVLGDALLAGAA